MSKPPKIPPRFVPTLTEVVPDVAPPPPESLHTRQPLPAAQPVPQAAAASNGSACEPGLMGQLPSESPAALQLPEGLEAFLVHRVMQRVDLGLDQRLRDAIAAVVQEQTRSVLPRLREEIESVVRQVVYEALADELASANTNAIKK